MRSSKPITSCRWVCVLVAALALGGCADRPRWNLLLVTFDTTRADHLGCYGNATIQTPNLDRLAREGIRFTRAYATIPLTLPSHTTIMTGRYPLAHGVRDNGLFQVAPQQLTLAELLRDQGYRTGAAVGGFPLVARYGLDQGFDFYDDRLSTEEEDPQGHRLPRRRDIFFEDRRAGLVNEALFGWLERRSRQPFCAWIHYYDPHQPQAPPPPYDALYADDPYDGEIAYADDSLGAVLQRLREMGVYERTLIAVTADHGEGLEEHSELTHAMLAYDSTLHVPLLLRIPGGPHGRVIEQRVSHVDLLPTVLEALQVAAPRGLQGRSLLPLLNGAAAARDFAERPTYAETLSPRFSHGWSELRALYRDRYKYIHGARPELFDLIADPGERVSLIGARPELARDLRDRLLRFVGQSAVKVEASVAADAEARQRLEALGYLGSGGDPELGAVERVRDDGAPPQDRVQFVSDLSRVKESLFQRQPLEAKELLERMLRTDSGSPFILGLLAETELQLGRWDAALEAFERQRAARPSDDGVLLRMALVAERAGDSARAEELVRQALEQRPSAAAEHRLALLLQRRGDRVGGFDALARALELDPGYVAARVDFAIQLALTGQVDAAEHELRRAIADHPYYARAFYNYGKLLADRGRLDQAQRYFDRAVSLDPNYLEAYVALGAVELDRNRPEQARRHLRLVLRRAPGSPEAQRARRLLGGA